MIKCGHKGCEKRAINTFDKNCSPVIYRCCDHSKMYKCPKCEESLLYYRPFSLCKQCYNSNSIQAITLLSIYYKDFGNLRAIRQEVRTDININDPKPDLDKHYEAVLGNWIYKEKPQDIINGIAVKQNQTLSIKTFYEDNNYGDILELIRG